MYFKKSKPIATDDGIEAKSKRGDIGEKWWSRRFVDVLESYSINNRIRRGKRYARKGQVTELNVRTGEVSAKVQGSRRNPYDVTLGGNSLTDESWRAIEEAMAERATFVAQLLAGRMPADIEEAFRACDFALFPDSYRRMDTRCSCPDSANPCKHIAAVFYLLAERFDDDPFLIFRWRGRSRDTLLQRLRELRGATEQPVDADADEAGEVFDDPADFWAAGDEVDELAIRPAAKSGAGHSVLDRIGDPPGKLNVLRDELDELYAEMME